MTATTEHTDAAAEGGQPIVFERSIAIGTRFDRIVVRHVHGSPIWLMYTDDCGRSPITRCYFGDAERLQLIAALQGQP